MSTQDISRIVFDPHKRYKNVQMQMGRVLIDDDWNENVRITAEDQRRAWADMIGPAGSPDAGFRVEKVRLTTAGKINFDLAAGSFYLGGIRLELPRLESFLEQKDQLQGADLLHTPAANRIDLVMLETYLQEVCAVEDSELLEAALGGPDTTTRQRVMQRVSLVKNVGQWGCDQAWQAAVNSKLGALSAENELVPDAKLKVGFTNGGPKGDLCSPSVVSGYLGAENQAIRVQIVDSKHFIWGLNNASGLYRISLSADRSTATLITQPKDQNHWPMAGQVVEILPWEAVLPNNEKIAAIQGHLTKVKTSFNPEDGTLGLVDAVPAAGFEEWKNRSGDAAPLGSGGEYYFLRVWDRGSDTASAAAVAFTPGVEVKLGTSGLKITLSGKDFLAGDYWVIAARPETPDQVVPWELEKGLAPHGLRRFYAPLGLIRWGTSLKDPPQVEDCRPHFRPLTRQNICCTYTVGDGQRSHGDFDSLALALQHMPAGGGRICLLPGTHPAGVVISGRENITIFGCGRCTKVIPDSQKPKEPLFSIRDSRDITLETMDLITVEGTAVQAEGSAVGKLHGIKVRETRILAYQHAVSIRQGKDILIEHNILRMLDKAGGGTAIFVLADDARIEHNDITVVPPEVTPPVTPDDPTPPNPVDPCLDLRHFYGNVRYVAGYANFFFTFNLLPYHLVNPYQTLGGIQVGSGAERIHVLDNTIAGGAGNGITLGSDLVISAEPAASAAEDKPAALVLTKNGVMGHVSDGKNRLAHFTLLFSNGTKTETLVSTSSPDPGYFGGHIPKGKYMVTPGDSRYRIKSIQTKDAEEFGNYLDVTVELKPVETNLSEVFDFIYDVTVSGNQIFQMGESGIGFPRTRLAELVKAYTEGRLAGIDRRTLLALVFLILVLGAAVGFTVNLQIRENHIRGCLRNQYDLKTEELSDRLRGIGGISLALCSGLVVRENRIELNGRSNQGPVHGVFVGYGTELDISNNQVLDNGLAQPQDLQRGLPGGITVLLSSVTDQFLAIDQEAGEKISLIRQALRIHDNLVRQPVGRALTALALGPVSIANNHLTTEFAAARASLLTGMVTSTEDFSTTQKVAISVSPTTWLSAAPDAGTVLVVNLGLAAAYQQFLNARRKYAGFPTGSTLFNDNQVRLAKAGNAAVSITLLSLDDLSFGDNQSEILSEETLLVNSLSFGLTVRAPNNRMQEPLETNDAKLSLFSYGVFYNTTALNQGNHCIIAQGGQVVEAGNLPTPEVCKKLGETMQATVAPQYYLMR